MLNHEVLWWLIGQISGKCDNCFSCIFDLDCIAIVGNWISETAIGLIDFCRLQGKGQNDGNEEFPCDTISTKMLFYLISTLNASFNPDYDFSLAKSEEFSREPNIQWVMNAVECQLLNVVDDAFNSLKTQLWNTIDNEICLKDCDIYSYKPDLTSDPYQESIWSFIYFFYNKKLKRIVFFTCSASSTMASSYSDSGSDEDKGYAWHDNDLMDCDGWKHCKYLFDYFCLTWKLYPYIFHIFINTNFAQLNRNALWSTFPLREW